MNEGWFWIKFWSLLAPSMATVFLGKYKWPVRIASMGYFAAFVLYINQGECSMHGCPEETVLLVSLFAFSVLYLLVVFLKHIWDAGSD